ncbi:MAG: hypothetical protein EOM87_05875 [Clostridia bacterium]|nr:hypothetical protein [Clostridia bacterium]
MFVNQIAVFLENSKGRLKECASVISNAGVDVVSMSIADTKDFGILRAITRDNAKAMKALKEAGFIVSSNDLIGALVEDRPGGLTEVLSTLDTAGIGIEYMYSFANIDAQNALILLKVDNEQLAIKVLKESGAKLVENKII